MLALAGVMASCGVGVQDHYRHSLARDLTFHWYAGLVLRCRNRHPFGTFPRPTQHLKTLPSDGAPAPQVVDSKDVYHWNNVYGLCFVTKNLVCRFALCLGATLWVDGERIL